MKKKQRIVIVSAIILVILIIAGLLFRSMSQKQAMEEEVETGEEAGFETITYQGERYRYNTALKTILFMGVDNTEPVATQEYAGRGGQADVLMVFILDTEKETIQTLQISRDAMIDVDVYDMSGEQIATDQAQIATQYAYGDGEKKSCLLTKEKVSELLYGIPIQSFFSLNIDGIATVSDAIGGIEITVPKDYTEIDPIFQKGAKVLLKGALAEKYVRYRDTTVTGSNNDRMERQRQVIEAAALQLPNRLKQDSNLYKRLWKDADPYMVTDLSTGEVEKLTTYASQPNIVKVPGEVVAGEKHDEYHVDDEKLYDLLVKLFYKKVEI